VAKLVKGFTVSSFWTAFFASIVISLLSIAIGAAVSQDDQGEEIQMPSGTTWL
jgi:putative membrane protein